jgi:hypothetical protein
MITTPGEVYGKCLEHNYEFCAVCVNTNCKKRLLCYQCIYTDHSKHISECIPLNLWKVENFADDKTEEMHSKIERATSDIRDVSDLIHNYISSIIERLSELKKSCAENSIDLQQIIKNLSLKNNFTLKDGYYVIKPENISTMIENICIGISEEMEGYLEEKLSKIKVKSKNFGALKKSKNRFSSFKDNWSHLTSYWDCIGFKIAGDPIVLLGTGIYAPDNITNEFDIKIKIFEEELTESKVIFEKDFEVSKLRYQNDLTDLMFGKEILLKKDVTYIIAKFNNKSNSNGKYGKEQSKESTDPFIFMNFKGKSDSYKSGNYSEITCGAFPYFIYR